MTQYRLGEIEAKFAALIWDNEPLTSAGRAVPGNAVLEKIYHLYRPASAVPAGHCPKRRRSGDLSAEPGRIFRPSERGIRGGSI